MVIGLFLVSLLTRFIFLYFGFPSITNDEADYFINSYLLAKTGSDIYSQKFFLTSGILNATSSVPVYLGSLVYHFFDKSVFFGRLPYAIMNSLIPVLFYLILLKLTKNKVFSFIGFTVLNFSPWFSFLSSQSAIDAPTALVFFLLAFYILLTNIKTKIKNSLFIIFSFLSFNSYMGMKTVFLFMVFTALLSKRVFNNERLNLIKILKDLCVSTMIFLLFFLISLKTPSSDFFKSRLKEKVLFLNTAAISKSVDSLRENSKGAKFIRYFLFNKVTVTTNLFLEKYIQTFNPYLLFYKGDSHPIYGTNYYGLFYLLDSIFLVIGLIFFLKLFKNNWLIAIPFIFLLLFSPIAVGIMIDGATISLRAYPMILGYVFFISCGIYYLFFNVLKINKIIAPIVFLIYLIFFLHFFSTYMTTVRYTSADQWHMNEKILMDKITEIKTKTNKKIIVYVNGPRETLLLYLFYKSNDPNSIKKTLSENRLNDNNVYFSADCPQEKITSTIQIIHSERCPINEKIFASRPLFLPESSFSSKYLLLE